MRRKRTFRTRRRIDEPIHSTPKAVHSNHLQTALRTGHLTPDSIMTLQRTVGNQAVIQRLGDDQPQTGAAAQTDAEKRLKEIIASLNPKKKDEKGDSEQYKKALQESLKAFLATDAGKQLKKQIIDAATSKQGLPLTLLVGSGVIAAMFAQNAGIPSIPDIPLGEGMSLNIDLDGTMQDPTGIKFTFKYKFGGSSKEDKPSKADKVEELPEALVNEIEKLDKRLLSEWILARAYHEYETATPEQKPAEKRTFDELKANAGGLPDTRLVAQALARALMEQAGETKLEFDMKQPEIWNSFSQLKGLILILKNIVDMVVPGLPEPAQSVEQVTFICGEKFIPLRVEKPEKAAEE